MKLQEAIDLRAAALQLALSHGTMAASGLSEFVDALLQPAAFQGLHSSLQQQLLRQLPVVLAMLALPRRQEALIMLTTRPMQG